MTITSCIMAWSIFAGLHAALVVIPVFFSLIPSAEWPGTEKWPAPAALVRRGVAELLAKGFPVSSGITAGESLIGVAIAMLGALHFLR